MNLNTSELKTDWNALASQDNNVPNQDFLCLVDLLKVSEELIYSSLPTHLIQKYKLVKQLIFNTILKNRDDGMQLTSPHSRKQQHFEGTT